MKHLHIFPGGFLDSRPANWKQSSLFRKELRNPSQLFPSRPFITIISGSASWPTWVFFCWDHLVGRQVCVAGVRGRPCSDVKTSSSASSHSSSPPLLHSNTSRHTSQCLAVCFMWPLGGSIISCCWEDGSSAGCSGFFFFPSRSQKKKC